MVVGKRPESAYAGASVLVSMPIGRIETSEVREALGLGVRDVDDVAVIEEILIYLSTDGVG